MPFTFHPLRVPGPTVVEPQAFFDRRGWFTERYKQSDFRSGGISDTFVQDNISYSEHGVLRGLHYQVAPAAQAKLVTVLSGAIFDVAVDLRRNSKTYLEWVGITLTAHLGNALYIPPQFAHGFVVTSHEALVMYKCSAEYNPQCERGIRWNDPAVGVRWPISGPIVSEKDQSFAPIGSDPTNGLTHTNSGEVLS